MKVFAIALLTICAVAQTSANHLAGAHSAYLARAAAQPVDWHPLDAESLALAVKLDRPLLIDVGATWCVWCERMDRESYSHPDVAAFINANFVAIKIDYDADPKLAAQLQRAAALNNQPSGLPLTLFVTPRQTLYFGGTYYPAAAFTDALKQGQRNYHEHGAQLESAGTKLDLSQNSSSEPTP